MRQYYRRLLAGALLLVLVAAAPADESGDRRAFEPGGQPTLVRTGDATRDKLMSAGGDSSGFSFSTREMYSVILYLDEAGARKAFAPFKGKSIDSLIQDGAIHQAVLDGEFPKMIVISFTYKRTAREVREDLAEVAGRGLSKKSEFGKLVGYFRKDLNLGDEAVIRFGPDKVMVTIAGEAMPDIPGRDFARALLGVWVGKDKMSGERGGLLSDAGSLLQ